MLCLIIVVRPPGKGGGGGGFMPTPLPTPLPMGLMILGLIAAIAHLHCCGSGKTTIISSGHLSQLNLCVSMGDTYILLHAFLCNGRMHECRDVFSRVRRTSENTPCKSAICRIGKNGPLFSQSSYEIQIYGSTAHAYLPVQYGIILHGSST